MRDKRSRSFENLQANSSPEHKPRPPHLESGLRHVRSEPHISRREVESVLSGLADNTVIVLPRTCCEAVGLAPNINDKQQPKHLWIGRLKHLNRLLSAQSLQQAVQPKEVRRCFLQAALDEVESRHTAGAAGAEIPMQLAQLPGWKLQQMAHAAIVIQKMWRGRRARQANNLNVLKAFAGCITKGTVVFLCGSTGIAGDSLRYVRMLAGMGYLVIAPDDLAGTSHLRRRQPRLIIRPDQATDYWDRNLLYEDEGAEGELVYSSTTEGVLGSPEHFDQIYNNIITVRQAEVSFTLRRLPAFIKRQGVFLFGMSEGAVTLSTFNDEHFAGMIRGRVLASYSCEMNYWNYNRPEDVGISGTPGVPTLNLMGFEDEYFGVNNSVAATVAAYGDYPPIAGHAFQPMVERGIEGGLVCHFEGGRHALLLTHDDVIREVLSDFLVRPLTTCRSLGVLWGNLPELQDEVTRVRRSADERVLYVRIRPPHTALPALPMGQQLSGQRGALLDALSAKLYEVEHRSDTLAATLSWSDLHLAPLPSPPDSADCKAGVAPAAGTSPLGSSPAGSSLAEASSTEGATSATAGVDKLKAKAASARLLAHFSFKGSLASQDSTCLEQQQGASPASNPALPAHHSGQAGSGMAQKGGMESSAAGGAEGQRQELRVIGFGSNESAEQPVESPFLAAASASTAAVALAGTSSSSASSQIGQQGAGVSALVEERQRVGAGALLGSSPTGGAAAGGGGGGASWQEGAASPMKQQQQQQQQQRAMEAAAVSALSAALQDSSGSPSPQASSPEGTPALTPAWLAGCYPSAAQPQCAAPAPGLGSRRGSASVIPTWNALGAGASSWEQNGALTAAAAIHFSPIQRLLASSLASERSSPFTSPTDKSSGGLQRSPNAGNTLGPRRHHHSRSLSAAVATATAAAASPRPTPEEFEAGLETLQGWMSSQGQGSLSHPGPPSRHSPQRTGRPRSAQSADDSQQRRQRSVHFRHPPAHPRSPAGSDSCGRSSKSGSSGSDDSRRGRDELMEGQRQRGPGSQAGLQAKDLQQLARAMAAQAQMVAKASEAAATSARVAAFVAAGSLAAVIALALVLVISR